MSTPMPPTPSSDEQPSGSPLSDLAAQSPNALETINIRGQLQWEKYMKDIDPTRRYRKVSVLMIHWEKESTDSCDAQEEVDRLSEVFQRRYKFIVTEKKLNTKKKAQLQINKHLSNFVHDEDDDDTLFIIYYAGHATPDQSTGRLLLANGNRSTSRKLSDDLSHIVWQKAESLIHSTSRPDIFLILDCCHAGRLLNTRDKPPWSGRIFEFLGATGPEGTTPLPGKESFTSALIWALEKLADEGEPFMSSELLEKILDAPDFHRGGQVPCMSGRGPHCVRKLILEPMPSRTDKSRSGPEGSQDEASEPFKYCLNLQFLLPDAPEERDVKRMCDSLRELIVSHRFYARQILWQGLYPKEHVRSEFPRLVREFAARCENKILKKKILALSRGARLEEDENDSNDVYCDSARPKHHESTGAVTDHPKRGFELDAANSEAVTDKSSPQKRLRKACD